MQAGQTKNGIGMTVAACIWLGLFPLIQFGTYSSITRDKWTCMLILTGVTMLCFVADLLCKRLSAPRLLPLIVGGAFLAWILASSFASPYSGTPWWIGAGRRDGLVSQLCYLTVFFLFAFSRVSCGPVLFSAGAGLCAFLAVILLQRSGGNPLGLYPGEYSYASAPGFQGTIGNVDMCSGYLLILCGLFSPVLVSTIRNLWESCGATRPGPKWMDLLRAFILISLILACLWLFVTMEVRFGLLSVCVLIVWTLIRFLPKKFWLAVLLAVIVLALVFVWYYPGTGISALYELHEVMHGRVQYSYGTERVGVWIYCAKLLSQGERLLLGTGPDTFVLRFNEFLSKYFDEHPDAARLKYYYDNPHNEYIALLLNCGVPAMLFFVILIIGGCFGRTAWRDSVLCYGIQALFSFSVCIVAPMFWVVLGMSYSRPDLKAANDS